MRQLLNLFKILIIIVSISLFIAMFCIAFNKVYFQWFTGIDIDKASQFGEFFGGFIGTLLSFLSIVLVSYSILKQTYERRRESVITSFYKMIDYHYHNVEQIKVPSINNKSLEEGRRAFVVFKVQIKRLIQVLCGINDKHSLNLNGHDIAMIAYMVFYYGLSDSWKDFIEEKISCVDCRKLVLEELQKYSDAYPNLNLCRTNQTILSAYYRNIYNAIKLIDKEDVFCKREKSELIKIFRAQLSNPELYVLFFNLISSFGTKWIDNHYVTKYSLLKNIPFDYLDGYNPKDYFEMTYEYEELESKNQFKDKPLPIIKSSKRISDIGACNNKKKKGEVSLRFEYKQEYF